MIWTQSWIDSRTPRAHSQWSPPWYHFRKFASLILLEEDTESLNAKFNNVLAVATREILGRNVARDRENTKKAAVEYHEVSEKIGREWRRQQKSVWKSRVKNTWHVVHRLHCKWRVPQNHQTTTTDDHSKEEETLLLRSCNKTMGGPKQSSRELSKEKDGRKRQRKRWMVKVTADWVTRSDTPDNKPNCSSKPTAQCFTPLQGKTFHSSRNFSKTEHTVFRLNMPHITACVLMCDGMTKKWIRY